MINRKINELIGYAKKHLYLGMDDEYYAVNRLLYLLKLNQFKNEDVNEDIDFFDIVNPILEYAMKHQLIEPDSISSLDAFEAKLIDCVMPRPSEINRLFNKEYKTGPLTATTFFHNLSIASNYIKTKRIEKNIKYDYFGQYGRLELTINLSKPEKDPKDIQKQSLVKNRYPACVLCMENVGVYQSTSLAPRSNHRVVSITINHEKDKWGFQYSPYAYFNEHCIILRKEHSPMYVNEKTFAELVDFINKFPHYLIGSNAGLPIVGGSILGHHHFQGGRYNFPIEEAQVLQKYKRRKVQIEVLDWPMAVLKVSSENENALLDTVSDIYQAWNIYDNPDVNIYSKTTEAHNTITPILKLNGAKYEFYVVLRNNYSTDELPYGLFHPREELFHIKKENIGLIEVMGLAILPGRLVNELDLIKYCLLNNRNPKEYPELHKHLNWFNQLIELKIEEDKMDETLRQEVGRIFEQVLEDCNVFKYGTKEDLFRFVEKII